MKISGPHSRGVLSPWGMERDLWTEHAWNSALQAMWPNPHGLQTGKWRPGWPGLTQGLLPKVSPARQSFSGPRNRNSEPEPSPRTVPSQGSLRTWSHTTQEAVGSKVPGSEIQRMADTQGTGTWKHEGAEANPGSSSSKSLPLPCTLPPTLPSGRPYSQLCPLEAGPALALQQKGCEFWPIQAPFGQMGFFSPPCSLVLIRKMPGKWQGAKGCHKMTLTSRQAGHGLWWEKDGEGLRIPTREARKETPAEHQGGRPG